MQEEMKASGCSKNQTDTIGPGRFDDYQTIANTTAIYPGHPDCLLYPTLGLVDEAAEFAEKVFAAAFASDDGDSSLILSRIGQAIIGVGKIAGVLKKVHRDRKGRLEGVLIDAIVHHSQHAIVALTSVCDALYDDTAEDDQTAEDIGTVYELPFLPVVITDDAKPALLKELCDPLWYFAIACTTLGVSMSSVAEIGCQKLANRKSAGTLGGSGDDR